MTAAAGARSASEWETRNSSFRSTHRPLPPSLSGRSQWPETRLSFYRILGVGCNPTSRTSLFHRHPPQNTHIQPLTATQSKHTFSRVYRKIKTFSGWNFERGSHSREKVIETLEHCFRSPPLTAIAHQTCGHVCSPCLWLPRPRVCFALRTLWLECDCKRGADHETLNE